MGVLKTLKKRVKGSVNELKIERFKGSVNEVKKNALKGVLTNIKIKLLRECEQISK